MLRCGCRVSTNYARTPEAAKYLFSFNNPAVIPAGGRHGIASGKATAHDASGLAGGTAGMVCRSPMSCSRLERTVDVKIFTVSYLYHTFDHRHNCMLGSHLFSIRYNLSKIICYVINNTELR